MSVDPLAGGGAADLAALIDAEMASLAADADALRALLLEDTVVTARVLPSNGLTDLLDIAGRRVAASLPPTVRPGDVLQVQVTGFDGDRILLQVVGTLTEDAAATATAPAYGAEAPAATPAAPPAASPAPAVSGSASPSAAGAAATPATLGPPAAASVPPPSLPGAGGPAFGAAVSRAAVSPSTGEPAGPRSDVPARTIVVPAGAPTSIEARLAAARATTPPSPGLSTPPAAAAHETPLAARAADVLPTRFSVPPPIAARVLPAHENAVLAESVGRTAPAAARGLAAYAEPVALLRALKLPVTPGNVASAKLALEQPQRLPEALAALERALPRAAADSHVATLRTLIAFVGRIDPRSPVLAAQIAAYVEHVVEGAEPKIATLIAAAQTAERDAAAPSADAPAAAAPSSAPPAASAPPARAGLAPAAESAASSTAVRPAAAAGGVRDVSAVAALPAAVAVERGAALGADLKQTLFAIAADPSTPAAAGPAIAGALSALTAVQVTAAQTLAANPNGIAFTIPLVTDHGPAAARIAVSREGGRGRTTSPDGENVRIAFVLDTAHYGTVAIDLVTVGREVTVDVRAENAPAMRAFRDALGGLVARLESLRYRVASAGAVIGVTSTVDVAAPPAAAPDPNALVDRSA